MGKVVGLIACVVMGFFIWAMLKVSDWSDKR